MSKKLFTAIIILCTALYAFGADADTTKSRDRGTTTKERIKKNGNSDSGNRGGFVYETEEEESFTDQCFSSCMTGFFEALFSGAFSSSENVASAEPTYDNYYDTTAALRIDSMAYEENDYNDSPFINEPGEIILPPDYRIYLNFGLSGENLTGQITDDYQKSAFAFKFSSSVFVHHFAINLSYSHAFGYADPAIIYRTTFTENGTTVIRTDEPTSAKYSKSSFSIGASYMLDINDFWGMELGGGGSYQKFNETSEFTRKIDNGLSVTTSSQKDELSFSGFYPYIRTGAYLYTNSEASFMLNFFMQYNFINREPALIKSTPMDWSKVSGEIIIGAGLSFNIL